MQYRPHEYQRFAIDFIKDHPVAAILLDMGLGKTSICLSALQELLEDEFEIRRVLVVAPLRVARDTWPDEIRKWDHLKGLTFSVAVGTEAERLEALKRRTDICIINRGTLICQLRSCFCILHFFAASGVLILPVKVLCRIFSLGTIS